LLLRTALYLHVLPISGLQIIHRLSVTSVPTQKVLVDGTVPALTEVLSAGRPKSMRNFRNLALVLKQVTALTGGSRGFSDESVRAVCCLTRDALVSKTWAASGRAEVCCDLIDACVAFLDVDKRCWGEVKLDKALVECLRVLEKVSADNKANDGGISALEQKLKMGMLAWSKVIGKNSSK
jgi:hypothetical protein